jgi:tRNA-dihydrouridine synthase B
VGQWLVAHLHEHYTLYGELTGVRSARKHIGWAVKALPGGLAFRDHMNTLDDCRSQVQAVTDYFDGLADQHPLLPQTAPGSAANDAHPPEPDAIAA